MTPRPFAITAAALAVSLICTSPALAQDAPGVLPFQKVIKHLVCMRVAFLFSKMKARKHGIDLASDKIRPIVVGELPDIESRSRYDNLTFHQSGLA